jgi:glycerophosphoryl diester phosphodiesterase
MRKRTIAAACLLSIAGFAYGNNAAWLSAPSGGKPLLLAHRGMAQTFHRENLRNDTCTATRIYPPSHGFLENTLPSMEAAFAAGAEIVEFDVHPTTDGAFAVFHDWTVDCRTEGRGVTREHALGSLKALDIGYGYTADGGKTFPFRGKGVGLMPSLDEVLTAFPDKRFLINIKSDDPAEGAALAERLGKLPSHRMRLLSVYGADRAIGALQSKLPMLKVLSMSTMKACGYRYLAFGWTGIVPSACRNMLLLLPRNYAHFLWGWPHRLVGRMRSVGSDVYVAAPRGRRDAGTSGIDTAAALATLPSGYDGGIWTDRIDVIGSLVAARRTAN